MVSIVKWLSFGLVGAFVLSALIDPQRAYATTQAFKGVGGALGSLGTGIQSLFTGVGTGASKLLNPLWTLRDLIYGPQAGVQVEKDIYQSTATGNLSTQQTIYETQQIQLDPNAPYTPFPLPVPLGAQVVHISETVGLTAGTSGSPAFTITGGSPGANWTFLGTNPVSNVTETGVEYYNSIGATVTPAASQTVAAQNSGNATGVSSASASYSAGAAQAAGYSTGAPTGS